MGRTFGAICNQCNREFTINEGGGFHFELLRCDRCGRSINVPHPVPEWSRGYQAGSGAISGWVASIAAFWKRLWQRPGSASPAVRSPRSARADQEANTPQQCDCGGHFIHGAPPRCPFCGSADYRNNPDFGVIMYD